MEGTVFQLAMKEVFDTAESYQKALAIFTDHRNKAQYESILGKHLSKLCFAYLDANKKNADAFLAELHNIKARQLDPITLLSEISKLYATQMPAMKKDFFPCGFVIDTWNQYCIKAQQDKKNRKLLKEEIACPTGPKTLQAEMSSVLAMPFQRPIRMKMLLETVIEKAKKTEGPFETKPGKEAIQHANDVLNNIVSPCIQEINDISKHYSKQDPKELEKNIKKTKAQITFSRKQMNVQAFGEILKERGFQTDFDKKENILYINSSQNIENFGLVNFDLIKVKQLKNGNVVFSVIHPKERTFTTLNAGDVFFELAKMTRIFQQLNGNPKFQLKCSKKNQAFLTTAFKQRDTILKIKSDMRKDYADFKHLKLALQELPHISQGADSAKLKILQKTLRDLSDRIKELKKDYEKELNPLFNENCKAAFDLNVLIQNNESKRVALEKQISHLATRVERRLKTERPQVKPQRAPENQPICYSFAYEKVKKHLAERRYSASQRRLSIQNRTI